MNVTSSVSPVQASTNTNTLVVGSVLNAGRALAISFTIQNSGDESIQWQVRGGNLSSLADGAIVQAAATVTAGSYATYAISTAPYQFYGIFIESTVDDNHGEATIKGIAKG